MMKVKAAGKYSGLIIGSQLLACHPKILLTK
jgi:hypothetical protein